MFFLSFLITFSTSKESLQNTDGWMACKQRSVVIRIVKMNGFLKIIDKHYAFSVFVYGEEIALFFAVKEINPLLQKK